MGGEKLSKDQVDITIRFSKVFEQTYTRFLDLKKSEAQAREAQIEASLERIRAKAMAMHNSKDIGKTTAVMFNELKSLGVETLRTGISIIDVKKKTMELWMSNASDHYDIVGRIPLKANKIFTSYLASWQKGKKAWSYLLSGDEVKPYYASLAKYSYIPKSKKRVNKQECMNAFMFSNGGVNAVTLEPLSKEGISILLRFAGVFDLTYRRYLDLTKAESQAREAQIETSLERVRAASMAMHNSQDIWDTTAVMFKELKLLGIVTLRTGIGIIDDDQKSIELWMTKASGKHDIVQVMGKIPVKSNPLSISYLTSWKKGEKVWSYVLKGDKLKRHYESLARYAYFPKNRAAYNKQEYSAAFFFSDGGISTVTLEPLTEEANLILQRFAGVFDNDLSTLSWILKKPKYKPGRLK